MRMLVALSTLLSIAHLLLGQLPFPGPGQVHAVAAGGGPVTQTGSALTFEITDTPTGTVSSTITVPSDATFIVVGITGWHNSFANFYSDGAMTFTKSSADTAMTAVQPTPRGDGATDKFGVAMYYMISPDTGSNKSLKWDWFGTEYAPIGALVSVTFWKSINTSTPVRGSGGAQADGAPFTTGTITAASGDLIIAYAGGETSGEGTVNSWSNLTLLTQLTRHSVSGADGAWATGSPSGNTTVAESTDTNINGGGLVAISVERAP